LWTIPDFVFHQWTGVHIDNYTELVQQLSTILVTMPAAAAAAAAEVEKVGWVGSCGPLAIRRQLLAYAEQHRDVLDVTEMHWQKDTAGRITGINYRSLPQLVRRFRALLDIEGMGYSGRVKMLLWSRRPLLLIDRPYREFFYRHLRPWQHYIPVRRDLSDLAEKARWTLQNSEAAQRIADRALEFARQHLTLDSCYLQWNATIQQHAANYSR
jgi:hypothetical protein